MSKKLSKRKEEFKSKIDTQQKYNSKEGFNLLLDCCSAKFDESIDVAVKLGVDPKQSDQQVRGAILLPHGLGKKIKVLVFAKGPKEQEAKEAGADYVGGEDLVEKIKNGWLDFDKTIATPDMMVVVSKVAKILGPRGLMPNPKLGSVTMNIKEAVENEKKGKLSFRVEKGAIVHVSIGKKSMGVKSIVDNFNSFINAINKSKPSSSKGIYLRSIAISSTMGPGIKIDPVNL